MGVDPHKWDQYPYKRDPRELGICGGLEEASPGPACTGPQPDLGPPGP